MSWYNFRNSWTNNGVYSVDKDGNDLNITKIELGGLIWGTPVHDGEGNTFIGSSDRRFHCISKDVIKWTYKLTMRNDSLVDSAAALHPLKKIVIVPGGDGYLHALHRDTGDVIWHFEPDHISKEMHQSGVVVKSFEGNVQIDPMTNSVYAGCDDDYLYCVDCDTGMERWSYKTNMMIWTCVCLLQKYIVFGSLDSYLYVVNAINGELVKKRNVGGEIKASIVADNKDARLVFCCTSNGVVGCYEIPSLNRVWVVDCGKEIYSTPAFDTMNNILVVATIDGIVRGLNATDGKMIWQNTVCCRVCSSILIVRFKTVTLAVFGGYNGSLFGLRINDGAILYNETLCVDNAIKCVLNSSPSIETKSNRLTIGCYDGCVYFVPLSRIGLISHENSSSPIHVMEERDEGAYLFHRPITQFIPIYRFAVFDKTKRRILNAALDVNSIRVPKPVSDTFNVTVSSNGKFIYLVPRHAKAASMIPKTFPICGHYYYQTGSWLLDRLQQKTISFCSDCEMIDHTSTLLLKKSQKSQYHSEFTKLYVSNMFCIEPAVLDTYIPAALDAQGGVCFVLGDPTQQRTVPIIMLPALPDKDGFVVDSEAGNIILLKGTLDEQSDRILIESTSPFIINAMGGSIPFSEFTLVFDYWRIPNKVYKGEGFSKTWAGNVKGNGRSYTFPSDLLPELCDYKMNMNCLTIFDCTSSPIIKNELTLLSKNDGINMTLPWTDATKLVTFVFYHSDPLKSHDVYYKQSVVRNNGKIDMRVQFDPNLIYDKGVVIVNDNLVAYF